MAHALRRHDGAVGFRAAAAIAAAIAAALVGACGSDSDTRYGIMGPSTSPADTLIEDNQFGPDVTLEPAADGSLDLSVWALISASDPYGIAVQSVKNGDRIAIETISGIAWFSDQSGWGSVLSTIYHATGQLASSGTAKGLIEGFRAQVAPTSSEKRSNPDRSKARDGYGRDMNGDYARNEGGIVVCMPSAHGPMYANDKNHLGADAASRGRFPKYLGSESDMKDKCFFPARVSRSARAGEVLEPVLERWAQQDGVLHVLAFDSDYDDNAGSYEIKFRIRRIANGTGEE